MILGAWGLTRGNVCAVQWRLFSTVEQARSVVLEQPPDKFLRATPIFLSEAPIFSQKRSYLHHICFCFCVDFSNRNFWNEGSIHNKPGFHMAVRCREAAAGIAGTIAAGMPPACRNHFNLYGNHFFRYRQQPQA